VKDQHEEPQANRPDYSDGSLELEKAHIEAESKALKTSISLLPWAVQQMDLRWN
jgi:hypothetical protein